MNNYQIRINNQKYNSLTNISGIIIIRGFNIYTLICV